MIHLSKLASQTLCNIVFIPVTVNLVAFDEVFPYSLPATQMYVLSSDNLTSGMTNVLLFIPVTLLGNDPDPIIQ